MTEQEKPINIGVEKASIVNREIKPQEDLEMQNYRINQLIAQEMSLKGINYNGRPLPKTPQPEQ